MNLKILAVCSRDFIKNLSNVDINPGKPLIYALFSLICIVTFLCVFGRTVLKAYYYTPVVVSAFESKESEEARMERIINEWKEKERLSKLRNRDLSRYLYYPNMKYESICNSEIKAVLDKYTSTYQIEPSLALALMKIESGFNPRAISRAGACGLMQLMPGTARLMGLVVNHEVDERLDPAKNIAAGVRYLRLMLNTFDNPVEAIAAYNIGPGVIQKGTPSNTETLQHVYKVIRLKYEYEQNTVLMQKDIALMIQNCRNQRLAMKNEPNQS